MIMALRRRTIGSREPLGTMEERESLASGLGHHGFEPLSGRIQIANRQQREESRCAVSK
jgi:hypothetical protein